MRTLRWSFVVVLSTLAVLACSRSHPTTTASPVLDAVAVDSLILEVENHNWSDIVVFVTHDGVVSRLTQVTANANTKLPIPSHLVGSQGIVRLSVRRIGGTDSFASEPLSVRTGSTLRLTVESRVATSSVAVW
jgi:broad specificity phosphatase PhoE